MLFTELSTAVVIFCLICVIFCLYIFVWMRGLARFCRDAVDFVTNQNKKALGLRRIAELDAAVTELTDAYNALYESNKKLRARIGMRKTRSDRKETETALDSVVPTDEAARAAYKARLRETLRKEGRL